MLYGDEIVTVVAPPHLSEACETFGAVKNIEPECFNGGTVVVPASAASVLGVVSHGAILSDNDHDHGAAVIDSPFKTDDDGRSRASFCSPTFSVSVSELTNYIPLNAFQKSP